MGVLIVLVVIVTSIVLFVSAVAIDAGIVCFVGGGFDIFFLSFFFSVLCKFYRLI